MTSHINSWILKTNNFKQAELEADVVQCQKNAIVLMSLKKLGFYWLLAVVSVVIPVLHFILVPLFLLIGFMTFFSQYKNSHFLHHGFYVCPLCVNRVEIKKIYLYEGMKFNCDICMEQLTLEQKFAFNARLD